MRGNSHSPLLVCDPAMTDEVVGYMKELQIPGLTPVPNTSASASEVPTIRRFGSMRMSVRSAPPVLRTARSAGWKNTNKWSC